MNDIPRITGDASRRVHGVISTLEDRWQSATDAAAEAAASGDTHRLAMLRGKRAGYIEAIRLLEAVEAGHRLPWSRGRRRRRAARQALSGGLLVMSPPASPPPVSPLALAVEHFRSAAGSPGRPNE